MHDLSGPPTLGELCDLVRGLDLFADAPPVRPFSRHYRRWAYESAALDLALRQSGVALHEALGIEPKPVRFVCSTRLGGLGEDAPPSSTEPLRKRLAKYPTTRFKLDPENDWTADLIAAIRELAGVDILDLKGHYKGTPVDVETDPALYRQVAEGFPGAYLEDPDLIGRRWRTGVVERPALRGDRPCRGAGARSGRRQGDLAQERSRAGA